MRIIAIVGDAGVYHLSCAEEVYGERAIDIVLDPNSGESYPLDNEGNELGVIFDFDDYDDLTCAKCLDPID